MQMKQVFVRIPNDNVLALNVLYGDWSQILRCTSNELLNTHKIHIDLQCTEGYPGSCGKFRRIIKKWHSLANSIVITMTS